MSSHTLLQNYIKLTEFLGHVLGPDYEVALHDLTDKNRSLIAIANNHISGRTLGAPLTDLAFKLIEDYPYDKGDYRLNYKGVSENGTILRSSTMFIKDDLGDLIGLLCINFDNSRYQKLSEKLLGLCHPDAFIETNFLFDQERISSIANTTDVEHFFRSNTTSAESLIENIASERNINIRHMSQAEKMTIISELNQLGVFNIKGSVREVADALQISTASVYRYLAKL